MCPLRIVCLLVGIIAGVNAGHGPIARSDIYSTRNSMEHHMKPSNWMSADELESLPSLGEITYDMLEEMQTENAAEMINKLLHLSHAKKDYTPRFSPHPNEILTHLYTPNKQKMSFKVTELPRIAKELKDFGDREVTIVITGLPQENETVRKATLKLVDAYIRRYKCESTKNSSSKNNQDYDAYPDMSTDSSEQESKVATWNDETSSYLVIIDLGSTMRSFKAFASLDVEEVGAKLGDILAQMTETADVPRENIHIIGSNIGAHVAGAAGRQFAQQTGHQLHRITGLDPSKIFARKAYSLVGLARGDAEFVDVIHTSAYGLGVPTQNGDVDFFPNGPNTGVPGADNIIEASMRAMHYFAESVIPGNERNFPAQSALSLNSYNNELGFTRIAYMGLKTDYNAKGDYVLQVNAKSPFGLKAHDKIKQNQIAQNHWNGQIIKQTKQKY